MKRNISIAMIIVLAMAMAGCAKYSLLKHRMTKIGGYGFEAEMPTDWLRFNGAKGFVMTKDGLILDKIVVERKRFNQKLESTKKVYLEDMTISELAEVEIDNFYTNKEIDKFQILENTPTAIADQSAFQLKYTFVMKGGLRVRGIRYGFAQGRWVYRVYYEAADQHYFAANIKAFKRFVETFKLL